MEEVINMDNISCISINLNHANDPSHALGRHLNKLDSYIAFVQEPHEYKGNFSGLINRRQIRG